MYKFTGYTFKLKNNFFSFHSKYTPCGNVDISILFSRYKTQWASLGLSNIEIVIDSLASMVQIHLNDNYIVDAMVWEC